MKEADWDSYLERQTEQYMTRGDQYLSNCCNAEIYEDSDICTECKEHCVTVEEEKQMCMDEIGDQKMEERRDEQHD